MFSVYILSSMFRPLQSAVWRGTLATLAALIVFFQVAAAFAADPVPQTNMTATVIVVVGAPGEEDYSGKFNEWASRWEKATTAGRAKLIAIGYGKEASTNEAAELKTVLDKEPKTGSAELWVVLLGHGTYDGKDSKFNLRGPDISAADLAKLLEPFQRPSAVIAAFSASAPFLTKLSAKDRVVITATRSGHEQNYSRFGEYISGAIADPEADLDKDGQTSLLEAYLIASRRTVEFYETEGRLATEHSLIDDNGDGLGTPADWFRGVRPVKKAKEGAQRDGWRAHQFYLVRNEAERRLAPEVRARRDELELAIAHLRESKATMPEDDYYQKLETLAVEMARLYEKSTDSPGNEK